MFQHRITTSYYKYYLKKYIELIYKLVRNNRIGANAVPEYVNFCCAELLGSLGRFDGSRNSSLTTFVYARLSGRLKHAIHQNNNTRYITETDSNYRLSDKSVDTRGDTDTSTFIKEMLATLNPVERSIISMYYIDGCSLRQAASNLHVSSAAVYATKHNILEKLRKRFVHTAMEK